MTNRNTPWSKELKQRATGNLGNIRISSPSSTRRRRPMTRCQQSLRSQVGTPGRDMRRRPRFLAPFRLTSTRPHRIRPLGINRLTHSPPMYLGRPLKRRRSRSSSWAGRLAILHITRCTRRLNCGGRTPPVTAIQRSQPDIKDGSRRTHSHVPPGAPLKNTVQRLGEPGDRAFDVMQFVEAE